MTTGPFVWLYCIVVFAPILNPTHAETTARTASIERLQMNVAVGVWKFRHRFSYAHIRPVIVIFHSAVKACNIGVCAHLTRLRKRCERDTECTMAAWEQHVQDPIACLLDLSHDSLSDVVHPCVGNVFGDLRHRFGYLKFRHCDSPNFGEG